MSKLHLSGGPHVRDKLTTGQVMYDVILALLPTAVVGVWAHGLRAALIIAAAVVSALCCEYVFDYVVGKPNTLWDGSAALTGLLLALCLPVTVPLYIPFLGSVFAVVVVKGLFGGLGKNFVNPALAARCFLLLAFGGMMTKYSADAVSSATPLVNIAAGDYSGVVKAALGTGGGIIGSSAVALLIGGIYLWMVRGITYEIPLATVGSFMLVLAVFGGHGADLPWMLGQLCAGGILMGGIFMATDPVTSPVTPPGQLLYGAVIGILAAAFRLAGSAPDSVSYAILLGNLATPLIDTFIVPRPFGYLERETKPSEDTDWSSSVKNVCIALSVAVVLVAGLFFALRSTIEQAEMAANIPFYQEAAPQADSFRYDSALTAQVEALGDRGDCVIEEIVTARTGSEVSGYVITVRSTKAFDGSLTVAVGVDQTGTVTGISYRDLHDSPGIGMNCGEAEFTGQFAGKTAPIQLVKGGGASGGSEVNAVSGASVTSGATVDAVNAAVGFWNEMGGAK